MKALTIKNPYAALIVDGYKKYEFRSWKTNYRGKVLIHAGLSFDNKVKNKFEIYNLNYEYGCIIGEADITDCVLVDDTFDNKLKETNNLVYSGSHVGLYAWKLENIVKYDKPVLCKGKLGLWNYSDKR